MGDSAVVLNNNDLPELKRNYKVFRFLGGNIVSFFGNQIYIIAIPLMVLSITGSALSMGIVAALERLPILLQPFTGVLSDRINRKNLLLMCHSLRGGIVACLGAIFITGEMQIWHLYVGAFTIGVLSEIYNTTQFALVPKLVRRDDLQAINSINTGFFNAATLIAPGLGGLVISFYNPGYALLLNSLSFWIAFLTILTIPMTKSTYIRETKQPLLEDIKEGFRFVIKTKAILYTNIAMLFSVFGTTLFLTMMVFHLRDVVHLDPKQIGILLSLGGVGAIGGALLTNFLRKFFSYRAILFFSAFIGGLSIILFSFTQVYWILIAANAIGTIAASMKNPCIITIRQSLTPDELLGRVQATSRFMTWVLVPLSAFLAGILSEEIGTEQTILIGGIFATIASFCYLKLKSDTSPR
ncbi:MFS family permease [Bacillus pakistanensis]|uniref:MFS family permease n=1 Tax=Rossellomorea pakistanensis TaxID=992288 RepID=A0ABS2N7H2_9BACI|nr:MFS transporter [Bacillus pakistanensis]MBM7583807.1 MFS family permease [Bacillus pakistanensis]